MELKQHQKDTVAFYHKTNGRCLNTSEPGTGKTATVATYLKESRNLPAIIVCPASVKGTWKDELKLWGQLDSGIVQGESGELPDSDILVINYNILKARRQQLSDIPYKTIVFDECQSLSDPTTAQTKAATALSRRATHVIGMSGTPITNRPKDFWPILHIIRPKEYPTFYKFGWQYCDPQRKPWGLEFKGCSNPEKLHKEIQPFTIGYKQEDVVTLPKRSIQVVSIPIDRPEEYAEAEQDFLGWMKRKAAGNVEKAKAAEAIVKTSKLLTLACQLKARHAVKWIKNHMSDGRKVIVFCTHTGMLDVMHRRIAPGQSVFINGSVPTAKRHAIVKQFQTDPDIRVFVGNVQACGSGITLTAATSTIMTELPWTASAVIQAGRRNYRIGQDKETELIFLVAAGTIEEKLAKMIQQKSEIASAILDGKQVSGLPLMDMLKEVTSG